MFSYENLHNILLFSVLCYKLLHIGVGSLKGLCGAKIYVLKRLEYKREYAQLGLFTAYTLQLIILTAVFRYVFTLYRNE